MVFSRRPGGVGTSDGGAVYRFDIRLQGEDETVFFDI
jgi:protocatechuate 3,4-dioxygenase beta subunit